MQFLSAGSLGLVAVAGIWLAGLFLGKHEEPPKVVETKDLLPDSAANAAPANAAAVATTASPANEGKPAPVPEAKPPAAVSPSPEVTKQIDDLMGGKW